MKVANHIEKPCDFPLEMGGGEWDEQFHFFAGMKRAEAEEERRDS